MTNGLQRINRTLETMMPFLTPLSVVLGILLSYRAAGLAWLVPWIFAWMTFAGSLNLNFGDMKKALKQPLPILMFLLILHVAMPLYAWGAGYLFFPGDPLTRTGMVLLLAIPTGVMSLIWVGIYKGNTALTLTMILVDTLLSPFLVPFALSALVGAEVRMDVFGMMKGLFWMVVFPSIVGMACNQWSRGALKQVWGPRFAPFSKVGLVAVVTINSAVVAPHFTEMSVKAVGIAAVCFFVVIVGYLAGYAVSKLFGWDRETAVAMTFNCGMRNISAGAVLAIQYFPPPVAVPVIMGMVFQQMTASLFAYLFFRRKEPVPSAAGNATKSRVSG
ncbi:bile acid:sodium symporter family protein [Paenibacillus alkalitolerans]|uniref:bile acid:sodium symporter family protein n=1 Tax=Paenibacillus alkalitolerans TaxID=2799335 RepID=UPI001F2F09E3|nr:bile acid:sodium symporter family protein [Paenibacillus alkalitolerans]